MELTKNVFFNTDKLLENTKVKISYTGKLFEDGAEEVYIHYGFGLLWDAVSEKKMEKTELGFQIEIDLIESDTLNFCLRNENNEWDNNNYTNYIFPIEKLQAELVKVEEDTFLAPHKGLRRTYLLSKKIRLAIYKIITYIPRLVSGNYSKKREEI